ncbi:MAG: phosphatidylserine decarboxylase family protein [Syntrophales bacterium]|nr:phosphatidylserine decarboxylase family protein [Syntrophales bacterium]
METKHTEPILKEGMPFIIPLIFLTLIAAICRFPFLAVLLGVSTLFVSWFFRNPERNIPSNPALILAPADGRIIKVENGVTHEMLGEPCRKVSIFMNVFNVHVNRAPCGGLVEDISYRKGQFFAANLDRAVFENEQNALLLRREDGKKLVVVQIAGLVARRIVCWVTRGTEVLRGQRFGMIKFGSRLDVYLPVETRILVKVGDRVLAGESPIGELP